MRESSIERQHRKIAIADGWMVVKIMAASPNGMPDRMYVRGQKRDTCRQCNRGRLVFIEWKAPDGVISRQQELRHEELRRAGVEVYVARSIEEANRILGIGNETVHESDL